MKAMIKRSALDGRWVCLVQAPDGVWMRLDYRFDTEGMAREYFKRHRFDVVMLWKENV